MPERPFIFQHLNPIIFCGVLLLSVVSCNSDTLWKIPLEDVRHRLAEHDYSFLKTIPGSELTLPSASILGRGAFLYLHHIFLETGMKEEAGETLRLALTRERGLWRDAARLIVLEMLLEEQDYAGLEKHARLFIHGSAKKVEEASRRMLVKALHEQGKSKEVLRACEVYFPDDPDLFPYEAETIVYKAKALLENGKEGWKNLLERFFIEVETTPAHGLAFGLLADHKGSLDSFDAGMQRLMVARNMLSLGHFEPALPLVEATIKSVPPSLLGRSTLLYEMESVYETLEKYGSGVRFFISIMDALEGTGKAVCGEMAGRLYRRMGAYPEAEKLLAGLWNRYEDPVSRDRAAWYYQDVILELSLSRFVKEVAAYSPGWHDPSYFDDILH